MPARSRRFLTTPRHEHAGDYSGGELQLVLRSGAVPAFPACACGPQLLYSSVDLSPAVPSLQARLRPSQVPVCLAGQEPNEEVLDPGAGACKQQ